jgi:ABC-type multidrug transport system permease subunit
MKPLKNNQFYRLCVAQFLETVREPEVLFWGMVFPILISIGLGLAFAQASDVKFRVMLTNERTTPLDSLLRTQAENGSRERTRIWRVEDRALGNTVFTFEYCDRHEALIALKRGEAELMADDSAGHVRYHFDPLNAQAQLAYIRLTTLLRAAERRADDDGSRDLTPSDVVPLTLRGVRYIDFLVPGLIAFGLMADMLWGISYTIIERRSQKLLRRMVATPMRRTYLLAALMLVRTLMNLVDAVVIILAMWLIFDVQIQGSFGALFMLFLAGNIAFTGIAVLISSRTSRTEVGNGWINAVQMPMLILSGIFFSYHHFPEWSVGVIRLLPLTALADGFRSVFNEGSGWTEALVPSAALTLAGLTCFTVGMKLFKWR